MSKHELFERVLCAAVWIVATLFGVAVWTVIGRGLWYLLKG